MTVSKIIAIIPARGGSKGIPRKNIISLAGQPLLAYTIQAAKAARSVDGVYVSTDSQEVAQVTLNYGAEVILRPDELSGDTEPSETALLHALEHIQSTQGYTPDLLVFLQCTSPLTQPEDIDGTVAALQVAEADSAFTASLHHRFIWRVDNGLAIGVNHDTTKRLRRQDREPEYVETGAVYVMRIPGFLKARHRFFGKTVMHVVPAERSMEIDEPADLKVAESFLRDRQRQHRASLLPQLTSGIVFDFDGVFTDNKVTLTQEGVESVRCDRSDGYGIGLLQKANVPMIVLSKESNPVVAARCKKLKLDYIQGLDDKLTELKRWVEISDLPLSHLIYVGNDINDLECMTVVGCAVCPSDAHEKVKPYARIILEHAGGNGAIRELAEMVIKSMKV